MGDFCSKTMDMCISSVLDADKIVFCWGMDDPLTQDKLKDWKIKLGDKFEIIQNEFNQDDAGMNGKQRNFYLSYLKKNYMDWNCLCLDADEVLDDDGINKLNKFLKENEKN